MAGEPLSSRRWKWLAAEWNTRLGPIVNAHRGGGGHLEETMPVFAKRDAVAADGQHRFAIPPARAGVFQSFEQPVDLMSLPPKRALVRDIVHSGESNPAFGGVGNREQRI